VTALVIALGGNAMTAPDGRARPEDQIDAVERAAGPIADVIASGADVVLTHGNGPQVGNILAKNELAASVLPPVPLDWCGAQTQGTLGMILMNAVQRAMASRGSERPMATIVSRTRVDPDDPAFAAPSKPIGRYLPADEAKVMMEHGQVWQDRGERGWRRVVASPEPLEIVDARAVVTLLAAGFVVVASGGGGVPVVRDPDGRLRGVEAVIDKDLSAALLARTVGARRLVIATDVPQVFLDFTGGSPTPLGEVTAAELRRHAADGAFGSGSMAPKVEAACRFVESGGDAAVITSLENIADAVAGRAGTIVSNGGG
jgi:carbamate kinase